jgi:protein required for attachment to host cells
MNMKLSGKIARTPMAALGHDNEPAGPHKAPRIWILVADRRRARLFKKQGKIFEFLGEVLPGKTGHTDLSNASIGNVVSSAGGSVHHQYAPHMNASRHDELYFARELGAWMDEAAAGKAFDRLVLVAPPRLLGELRQAFTDRVLSCVTADVHKELTQLSEQELAEELQGLAWF